MLLSRVADALYWLSRYLERAEHTARLIDVRLDLGLDRTARGDGWRFDRLFAALQITDVVSTASTPAELIDMLIFDSDNPASVLSCVTSARENARQVREEISSEMWEQVNAVFLRLKQARNEDMWSAWSSRPHYLCRPVIDGVHLFAGVTDATMLHGQGWQYLEAGRYLERAAATAAMVDLYFRDGERLPPNHSEWVGLLRSCSALEAYCRCYTADLRPELIAEFLLLNPDFPRSVRFSAARVESALRAIAQLSGRTTGGRAERLAGRLHASLDYGQVDEILSDDPHAYLQSVGSYCTQIHAAAYQSYIMYPIESALPA
jgi:uncharacterized alpha-E superfamily protein